MANITINITGLRAVTRDAGFDESKHKRDHGKFSSTGGSGGGKAAPKPAGESHPASTLGTDNKVKGSWKTRNPHSEFAAPDPTKGKKPVANIKLNPKQSADLDGSHAEIHHTGEGKKAKTHVLVHGGGQANERYSIAGHHDPEKALAHYHKSSMRGT